MTSFDEIEWSGETIYTGLARVARRQGPAPAVMFEDRTVSYEDLVQSGRRMAAGLAQLGVKPGDTMAVWLANRPLWIQSLLAASCLGAAVVAVNTRYRRHEIEYMLQDSSSRVLITEEEFLGRNYLQMLAEVVPVIQTRTPPLQSEEMPCLEYVLTLREQPEYPGALPVEDLLASDLNTAADMPLEEPDQPVVIFYTSGTTSRPKGCLHSNRSVLEHSFRIGQHFDLDEEDVAMGGLPFCGVMGFNIMLGALAHGIPLVAQPYFDPGQALNLIGEHGVTYFSGMNAMFQRMIELADFTPERVESLRKGAFFFASGFDEKAFEQLEQTLGCPLVQPYGLSEGNSQIFMGRPEDPLEQRKKVGGPLIDPEKEEVRVVDPDSGEELAPGEQGELCLRGQNLMLRYLNKPDKTGEVFDEEGWLHTGDLGRKDEQGYFYWDARLDDALRVRGFLVSPRDIEDALQRHPGVVMAQVVGAPHPRHGQVPVAFVKTDDDQLTPGALARWLSGRVADYKIPEETIFVEEFPRTDGPHGPKIQKTKLRDRIRDHFRTAGESG